jgi:hypothetical protein
MENCAPVQTGQTFRMSLGRAKVGTFAGSHTLASIPHPSRLRRSSEERSRTPRRPRVPANSQTFLEHGNWARMSIST